MLLTYEQYDASQKLHSLNILRWPDQNCDRSVRAISFMNKFRSSLGFFCDNEKCRHTLEMIVGLGQDHCNKASITLKGIVALLVEGLDFSVSKAQRL